MYSFIVTCHSLYALCIARYFVSNVCNDLSSPASFYQIVFLNIRNCFCFHACESKEIHFWEVTKYTLERISFRLVAAFCLSCLVFLFRLMCLASVTMDQGISRHSSRHVKLPHVDNCKDHGPSLGRRPCGKPDEPDKTTSFVP